MPIRVVIVEDEKPARDRLRRLLADQPDVELVGEATDAASAAALIDRERPDLCFLDVEMPEGDGFEVLRRVKHAPRVIFTTAYDRYAVPAFEVNSLDYLLKPFSRERFDAALGRARAALQAGGAAGGPAPSELVRLIEEIRRAAPAPAAATGPAPPLRIPVRRASKIVLLDPGEILWFEAEETIVFARTDEARLLVERPLNDLEELLKPGFFRIHRAYLVNVSRIAEIQPEEGGTARVVMKDAARTALPLSRRQARLLRDLLPW